jgi:hypothetical protein
VAFYDGRGLLKRVDGRGSIEQVTSQLLAVVPEA